LRFSLKHDNSLYFETGIGNVYTFKIGATEQKCFFDSKETNFIPKDLIRSTFSGDDV